MRQKVKRKREQLILDQKVKKAETEIKMTNERMKHLAICYDYKQIVRY